MPRAVLVVEDDEEIRSCIVEVLESDGYVVKEAPNGLVALDVLRDGFRPCVILLDLLMPVMTGWEFRAEQERDPAVSEIPVIALSAHARSGLPGVPLLRKPVTIEQLLAAVRKACSSSNVT